MRVWKIFADYCTRQQTNNVRTREPPRHKHTNEWIQIDTMTHEPEPEPQPEALTISCHQVASAPYWLKWETCTIRLQLKSKPSLQWENEDNWSTDLFSWDSEKPDLWDLFSCFRLLKGLWFLGKSIKVLSVSAGHMSHSSQPACDLLTSSCEDTRVEPSESQPLAERKGATLTLCLCLANTTTWQCLLQPDCALVFIQTTWTMWLFPRLNQRLLTEVCYFVGVNLCKNKSYVPRNTVIHHLPTV